LRTAKARQGKGRGKARLAFFFLLIYGYLPLRYPIRGFREKYRRGKALWCNTPAHPQGMSVSGTFYSVIVRSVEGGDDDGGGGGGKVNMYDNEDQGLSQGIGTPLRRRARGLIGRDEIPSLAEVVGLSSGCCLSHSLTLFPNVKGLGCLWLFLGGGKVGGGMWRCGWFGFLLEVGGWRLEDRGWWAEMMEGWG